MAGGTMPVRTKPGQAPADASLRQLGEDLHDGPMQLLHGLQMFLARKLAELGGEPAVAAALKETASRVDEILVELRALAAPGDKVGCPVDVGEALASTVARLQGSTAIPLSLDVEAGAVGRLSAAQGIQVLWLVRSALTNCLRHARAGKALVKLESAGERLRVVVHDDGDGFDPVTVGEAGLGLRSMRQRVAELGGTLEIQSRPGGGTRVVAEFPFIPA
jgi:signal transduction histidine kinase